MKNIVVSACLLGIACRYDGKEKKVDEVLELTKKYNLIPVCPEQLGGLPTPRIPCEIVGDKAINQNGVDCTKEYVKGAYESLKIAKIYNSHIAILKEKSPSCGCKQIYDGTFSKTLIDKKGITAKLFDDNKITVIGESELEKLKDLLKVRGY